VWTIHDTTFPPRLFAVLAGRTAAIITVSEFLAEHHRRHCPAGRLVTIPNGVPAARPPAPGPSVRSEHGVADGAPLILHVGRLVPGKGADRFIEAAARVASACDDAEFLVVGDADPDDRTSLQHRDAVADLIDRLGLRGRARLVGQRTDVDRYYRAADLFAYTAIEPEGLPTVILEAMHHGLPVVASDCGGATELVGDGTGRLVPPGCEAFLAEALIELIGDREERVRLSEAARARAGAVYRLDQQAERVQAVYERVLRG
jgi:glycosyltransferase involved in cell wall biosynthesis